MEIQGLTPGRPRYTHVHTLDIFQTRWGDFDIYFREVSFATVGVLTIRNGDHPTPRRLMTLSISRYSDREYHPWRLDEIVSATDFLSNGRRITSGQRQMQAKYAVDAFNRFITLGLKREVDEVGDAMCRLDTVRSG